jgi:hypothetical protein
LAKELLNQSHPVSLISVLVCRPATIFPPGSNS